MGRHLGGVATFGLALCLCLSAVSGPLWAGSERGPAGAQTPPESGACVPEGKEPERLTERQLACVGEPHASRIREIQAADPAVDARREAGESEFGLLGFVVTEAGLGAGVPGIACAFDIPWKLTRGGGRYSTDFIITGYAHSDGYRLLDRALLNYAGAYNRALVSHERFPYAEICRPLAAGEKDFQVYRSLNHFRRKPVRRIEARSLHDAVRRHDAAAVRTFLKQGADPNEVDVWGLTPLGWAVLTGRTDLVRRLTPLMDALNALYRDPAYLEVIEELLKHGAAPNRPDESGHVVLDQTAPDADILRLHAFSALYFSDGAGLEREADDIAEQERRFEQMQEELRRRYAAARRLLMKYGAKTRAQLEKEGALEPLPKPEPKPEVRIPVR